MDEVDYLEEVLLVGTLDEQSVEKHYTDAKLSKAKCNQDQFGEDDFHRMTASLSTSLILSDLGSRIL